MDRTLRVVTVEIQDNIYRKSFRSIDSHSVRALVKAADTIQKLFFRTSDYHKKENEKI